MPARFTNKRPPSSPRSICRVALRSASAIASSGCRLIPSSVANPFPDPEGTMPIGTTPKARADATSLIVQSPPHARTSRASRATAALASSRACPGRSVMCTSARSPCASTTDTAVRARPSIPARRAPPEMGLMMTATGMFASPDGPRYFIARRRVLLSLRSVSSTASDVIFTTRYRSPTASPSLTTSS